MVGKYELQGFFFAERVFDTVQFVPTLKCGQPPAPKASENRPVRGDENRLRYSLTLEPNSIVELGYVTVPTETSSAGCSRSCSGNRMTGRPSGLPIAVGLASGAMDEIRAWTLSSRI
jgi:hypothetical protein